MEINLDEILTPDEKTRFLNLWFRRKRRSEYRRRIFARAAWLIKKLRKTAPNNPPLLAQCGAPAFRCRGVVADSSLLPRRTGAALDLGCKAMPERDAENKGRINLPPSAGGDETPDGYQEVSEPSNVRYQENLARSSCPENRREDEATPRR